MKTLIFTGGKTGGHIYPLLKVIDALDQKKVRVKYYGMRNSLEEKLCLKQKIEFIALDINEKSKIHKIISIIKEGKRIKSQIDKGDVILSSGGFVSIPLLLAGRKNEYYLLEENSVMGVANRLFARKAKKILLTFPLDKKHYKNALCVGNPSADFEPNLYEYQLDNNYINVLVIGGSKGSKNLCEYACGLANSLDKKYKVILVAGSYFTKYYAYAKENFIVYEYLDNLYNMMYNASIIISRGGSSTISEAVKCLKPLIVIPSRSVKDDHQYKNAMYLMKNNACIIFDEEEESEILVKMVVNLLSDIQLKSLMRVSQRKLIHHNNALEIANIIKGE